MTLDELLPSTEEEEKTGAVKEPAKRWRNLWMIHVGRKNLQTGDFDPPGIRWSHATHSTEAQAREDAHYSMRVNSRLRRPPTWLGAFPLTDE